MRTVLVIENLVSDFAFQPLSWFFRVYLIVDFQLVATQYEAQLEVSNFMWCWVNCCFAMEPTEAVFQLGSYQFFVSKVFWPYLRPCPWQFNIRECSFPCLLRLFSTSNEVSGALSWALWSSDKSLQSNQRIKLTWTSLAFGDSYTYIQGTDGLQNYSFIGDLQNYTSTLQQLLSDQIVQNQVSLTFIEQIFEN
jgi:hypothetical protein